MKPNLIKSFNFEEIVKPAIGEIDKYQPGESEIDGEKKIIKLSSNESPFKIPINVIKKTKDFLQLSNLYPDSNSVKLKKTLAKTFNIKSKNIMCGNGSDDVLSVIAQTFSTEGSEVICSEYGFTYYPIIAKASGCKVITANSEKLGVSCKNILKKITKKTKIIFFANPNNPTGTIIFRDELIEFLHKVPKNIIVVLDGAYSEFINDKRYSDGIDLVENFQNLIITRTFSKIFSLAGLRLGWGYSNTKIIELLEKVRGPFNVNIIAQNVGRFILEEKKFLSKSIKHNDKWRVILPQEINRMGLKSYKTFANFVLVKVDPIKFSKSNILQFLKKKKIIVRDLDGYGLKDFFRVSIGSTKNLERFLIELKKSLKVK